MSRDQINVETIEDGVILSTLATVNMTEPTSYITVMQRLGLQTVHLV